MRGIVKPSRTRSDKGLHDVVDEIRKGSDTNWWPRVRPPPSRRRVLFGYVGNTNKLKIAAHGTEGLPELVEELDGGQVRYGFVRVKSPGSDINKFVYISFVGDGVPAVRKGMVVTGAHASQVSQRLIKVGDGYCGC